MSLNKLLVSTKFAPPRVGSRYVQRKQLLEALERGKNCKLTLVSGSAGFGKTILLAQWRQELMKAGLQVAWLSLSHDERLLPNFCAHLFDALARLGVPLDEEVLLAGDGSASIDAIAAALVNGLAAIDDDLYLILDDCHHVEDPLAHRLIQKLLDHGSGNLHLIIASRSAPPLSLARLRVMAQVAEVECADLPFDLAETRAFLEQNVSGMRFSADEVGEIHTVTNGWPASLQLLAISLKNRPESRATLHNLGAQSANLQNYLSEDVVARLSTELAQFMESISICRRFNAALAEAITGSKNAVLLLQQIEDENLLIMRAESEDRSPWYRFHPLFTEFLMARLERRGEEAVNALHRRASLWFAEKGLIVEALRHATLGHDVPSAVSITERTAHGAWSVRHLGPMLHLVNNLSPESIASHSRLLYLGALTLAITGRHNRAAAWIEQMRSADSMNTRDTTFRVALASALSALQRDDTAKAVDYLDPLRSDDATSAFERHIFVTTLATSLAAAGRYADAHRLLDAHPHATDGDRDDTGLLLVAGCRDIIFLIEGKVIEAERASIYTRALASYGRGSVWTSMSAATLASVLYEQDRIEDARELLANRLHIVGASSPEIMTRAVLCQARLDCLQDSPEAALALLERQAAFFRSIGLDRPFVYTGAEQVRILVGKGDVQNAADVTGRLEQIAGSHIDAGGFRAEIPAVAALARARVELASGRHEPAMQAIKTAKAISDRLDRGWLKTVCRLLAATTLSVAGRTDEASVELHDALRLGHRLGLTRTFVDEGEPLYQQMQKMQTEGTFDESIGAYAQHVLNSFEGTRRTATTADVSTEGKTALTPREMEMVGLIAAGMSNKRIAQTLNIRLETVKWNLKNVFVKLKVSSRYDATIRARRLGLIK